MSSAAASDRDAPRFHRTAAKVNGALVYAIGDIHGRYDLFKLILSEIVADAATRAQGRQPILIPCGDYIDRGPDSAKVLSALDWIARDGRFDLQALKGNHEAGLLAFIDRPREAAGWLNFGGDATLRSYGVAPPADFDDGSDCVRARDDLLQILPVAHLRVLEGLKLISIIGDYAFVHAGIRPGVPLDQQKADDLLWIRGGFLEEIKPFEKRIVHGHSWSTAEPEIFDNRIGLDTGAYETGVLTAVRIEDGAVEELRATC